MSTEEDRAPLSTEVSPQRDPSDGLVQVQAAAEERLTVGEKLSGRYRIERELGEGGMGVVYLVTDEQVIGETFAVKVLKDGLDPQALELLREEVRKTRKLSHPNIVDVHSVNVDGKKLYVLMEYLEGKSLNALLDEEFGRGMAFSHVWPIIEDVGAALGYAHDHNVIHSDLKPANIFLTTSGKTKLLDFGIARVSRGPLLHQRSGPLALTPAYASCEMLRGKEADARDDIYSFACVIYEMLCGKRPFGELTALEARQAGSQLPPLQMLTRGQNAALAKALAFDREGRTSSVEKLLEGLAADRRPRARPIAVVGGAIIAALAALGLTYLVLDKLWLSRHSVVVESVAPDAQLTASRASATGATFNPPPHSIAVLPFADMSEKQDQEYFADGLAEELLDLLAKTPGLHVIARTSSFSFRGKSDDIPTIAAKLKVENVLEGSVRKSGNKLRVSTQLVHATNGEHIWSETYDREMKDLFKVQDDIANEVVQALKVKLAVTPAAERAPTDNMAAHNFLLEGRFFADRWAPGDSERAISSLEHALKEDPNYALAWAELSWAEMWSWEERGRSAGFYESATHAALRAIELRPDLAQAHATRGWCESLLGYDWAVADMEFNKALALDPQNMRALYGKGRLARVLRRTDESLHYYQVVLERDPVNAFVMQGLVSTYLALGKPADAVRASRKAFELSPTMGWDHWYLGYTLLWNGELEEALREMRLEPAKSLSLSGVALVEQARRNPRAADAALRELLAIDDIAKPYFVAAVYAARGDSKSAIAWLERARVARVGFFGEVTTDPAFNAIRGDSAFVAYLRRMKLPG